MPARNPDPLNVTDGDMKDWWRKLDLAKRYQKSKFQDTWDESNRLWEGEHWPDLMTEERNHRMTINLIPTIVRTWVESYTFDYPDFTIIPMTFESWHKAEIAKQALSYYWRKCHIQQELKRAVYDKELYGFGVVIEGWHWKDKKGNEEGTDGESVTKKPKKGSRIDQPFVKRIPPIDFFVPPKASYIVDEWDWCAWRETKPVDEVKKDKRYKNVDGIRGTTDTVSDFISQEIRGLANDQKPSDVREAELFHIYQKNGPGGEGIYLVLCKEVAKPLLVKKWEWEADRYPFRTIHGMVKPDDFYGKATPVELRDEQMELNEARSQLMNHARQFNRMFQIPEGIVDEISLQTLESGADGGMVFHSGPPGSAPIQVIPHLPLQIEVYKRYEWAQLGMELRTGLSQYQFHSPPTKRTTAGEVQAIQQAGGVLFLADAQLFTNLCEQVGLDMLDWMMQKAADVTMIPIYDQDMQIKEWTGFTGEDIKGEYMVTVNVNSTQPPNKQSQIQDAGLMFQNVIEALKLRDPNTGQIPREAIIAIRMMAKAQGLQGIEEMLPLPPMTHAIQQPGIPGVPGQPGVAEQPQPGVIPQGTLPQQPPQVNPTQGVAIHPTHQAAIDAIPPDQLRAILQKHLGQQG